MKEVLKKGLLLYGRVVLVNTICFFAVLTMSIFTTALFEAGRRETVLLILAQIVGCIILISFIYPYFWQWGSKDSNLVHFKHKKQDKLKGLWSGLVAIMPNCVFLLSLLIFKKSIFSRFSLILIKYFNAAFFSLFDLVIGNTSKCHELEAFKFVILIAIQFIIPIISFLGYLLGYNNYSFEEKLIYKKRK